MADIWSCGVILFQMLTQSIKSFNLLLGLPFEDREMHRQFEKMTLAQFDFPQPMSGKPFKKLSKHVKNLIRGILNPNPAKRPSIKQIRRAKWFREAHDSSSDDDFTCGVLETEEFRYLHNPKVHKEEYIPTTFIQLHNAVVLKSP